MRALILDEMEPITPFVDRVRQLYAARGVSTLMVVGGVGDYLAVADRVIAMVNWSPVDVTERAKTLAGVQRLPQSDELRIRKRLLSQEGLRLSGKGRIRARDEQRLEYGNTDISLGAVEQVLDSAGAVSVGHAIRVIWESMPGREGEMSVLLNGLEVILASEGLDALSPFDTPIGGLTWPRRHEVAAGINRLRTIEARLAD